MGGILNGVRIVDVSRILAGPYATQMLSDLGAEVIKVEAPWGDDTRKWGPPFTAGFDGKQVAAYFLSCNRGKEIVTFDLKQQADEVRTLIDRDRRMWSLRTSSQVRSSGSLGRCRTNVIVCSISAYGASGPRRDEPGYDVALQARSGIMGITGEADASPVKVGVAWIDVITGLNAGNAILAALYHKEKTGESMQIDISLWDCAVAALVNQAHNAMASGKNPQPMGSAHPNLVPYRAFKANDGWFVIGVGSDNQWSGLATHLSIPAPDEWSTNEGRVLNRASVEKAVGDAVSTMSRMQLESLLVGIPCAPVNTVLEALNDPQSVSRGAVTQHKGVDVLASPLRFMQPSKRE